MTGKGRDTLQYDPYDFSMVEYVNFEDLYGKDKVDRLEAGFSLGGYILKTGCGFSAHSCLFTSEPRGTSSSSHRESRATTQAHISTGMFWRS